MHYKKGIVVSAKGNKTIVVMVESKKMHPKYRKYFTVTKKYHAHDEDNRYKNGDTVMIRQVRPISKLKRWLCVPEDSIDRMRNQIVRRKQERIKKVGEMTDRMIDMIKTKGNKAHTAKKKQTRANASHAKKSVSKSKKSL